MNKFIILYRKFHQVNLEKKTMEKNFKREISEILNIKKKKKEGIFNKSLAVNYT